MNITKRVIPSWRLAAVAAGLGFLLGAAGEGRTAEADAEASAPVTGDNCRTVWVCVSPPGRKPEDCLYRPIRICT